MRSPLEDENENLLASLAIEISDLNKLKRENEVLEHELEPR